MIIDSKISKKYFILSWYKIDQMEHVTTSIQSQSEVLKTFTKVEFRRVS